MAVEHNAYPDRLDLCDIDLRRARELGCNIVINTDSHHISHLDAMHYGVRQLRRAWLTKADVLNTRPVEDFLAGVASAALVCAQSRLQIRYALSNDISRKVRGTEILGVVVAVASRIFVRHFQRQVSEADLRHADVASSRKALGRFDGGIYRGDQLGRPSSCVQNRHRALRFAAGPQVDECSGETRSASKKRARPERSEDTFRSHSSLPWRSAFPAVRRRSSPGDRRSLPDRQS